MKKIAKSLWKFLNEKMSITIIPSSRYKIKTFSIRMLIPLMVILLIIVSFGGLGYLYKYYKYNYFKVDNEFTQFKDRTNVAQIISENKRLKEELVALNQDTEELRGALLELKEYNQKIRNMLESGEKVAQKTSEEERDVDLELTTILSYNQNLLSQGIFVGGNEFSLYFQKPDDMIREINKKLETIKEEIPSQRDNLDQLESSVQEYNARKAATPSVWPLADKGKAYISCGFGWRNSPFTGEQEYHEGLDIAVWYNTPVLATADGVVIYAGWLSGYGYMVKLKHGFGYSTYYGHLNKIKVKKGQNVKRGQLIALTGNSGRSTGPHLHYEVRVNNIPRNPRKFIGR